MNVQNKQIHRDKKYISDYQRLRKRKNGEGVLRDIVFLFEVTRMFLDSGNICIAL